MNPLSWRQKCDRKQIQPGYLSSILHVLPVSSTDTAQVLPVGGPDTLQALPVSSLSIVQVLPVGGHVHVLPVGSSWAIQVLLKSPCTLSEKTSDWNINTIENIRNNSTTVTTKHIYILSPAWDTKHFTYIQASNASSWTSQTHTHTRCRKQIIRRKPPTVRPVNRGRSVKGRGDGVMSGPKYEPTTSESPSRYRC